MINYIVDRIMNRWLFSISKHLLAEARNCAHCNQYVEANILLAIASALNQADGKMP